MTTAVRGKLTRAASLSAIIFLACILITFTPAFKTHPQLSIPLLLDLLVTAPLAYFLVIRRSAIPKITVLRVGMIGIFIATLVLSKSDAAVFTFIKIWVSPLVETTLIGWIVWKFYAAKKQANNVLRQDFLIYCRAIMHSVCGSRKIGNALASEIAVFYYIFKPKDRGVDHHTRFTCYRENGTRLVLCTFLALFLIETAGMHFVFLLWNKTAAWILTGLGFYTCLQLFAHIRALNSRPILLSGKYLLLRNGLMGGDAKIDVHNIAGIEKVSKSYSTGGEGVQKLAFIKGLENHNTAIYLKQPVELIKAFGIKKKASVILLYIDKQATFIETMDKCRNSGC